MICRVNLCVVSNLKPSRVTEGLAREGVLAPTTCCTDGNEAAGIAGGNSPCT